MHRPRLLALAWLPMLAVWSMLLLVDGALGSESATLPAPQELPPNVVAAVLRPAVELETISTAEFERAMVQGAALAGLHKAPTPGENGYAKLMKAAMASLLDQRWIPAQAAEMGIAVTPKQVARELARIKKENFKTEAAYRKFLRYAHYTQRDMLKRVELQMLSSRIVARVLSGVRGAKARRRALNSFVAEYAQRWRSRTVCAAEYAIHRCSNGP